MLLENGTVDDAQYGRLMDEIRADFEKIAEEKKQVDITVKSLVYFKFSDNGHFEYQLSYTHLYNR